MILARAFVAIACASLMLAACAHLDSRVAHGGDDPISAFDGGAIYMQNCATCHGARGAGVAGVAPGLREGARLDAPTTLEIIARGSRRAGSAMPAWCGTLDDLSIADVVAYIRVTWGPAARPPSMDSVRAACNAPS
ncbi:MAG TPA: cytochrome c [Candidatus Dormibacteraeota bacterium]|nr:cytochrome c [Candidatus Dormibacteraeota bacterium]